METPVLNPAQLTALQAGALYVVQVPSTVSVSSLDALTTALNRVEKEHGVHFLIVDEAIEISEVRPVGAADIKQAVQEALREILAALSR